MLRKMVYSFQALGIKIKRFLRFDIKTGLTGNPIFIVIF